MSIAENLPVESAPSEEEGSLPFRTRTNLEVLLTEIAGEMTSNMPTPEAIADKLRGVCTSLTDRSPNSFTKDHLLLTPEQQRTAVTRSINSLSDKLYPDKAAWLARVLVALETSVHATMRKEQEKKAPAAETQILPLEGIADLAELSTLQVEEGLFSVFELLDGAGKPLTTEVNGKTSGMFFEIGRTASGLVANKINSSGYVEETFPLSELPTVLAARGGTSLRRLSGTHSDMFDFSASAATKRP